MKEIRITDIGIFPNTGAVWVEYAFEFDNDIIKSSSMTLWPNATDEEIEHELINKYKQVKKTLSEIPVDYKSMKNKKISVE